MDNKKLQKLTDNVIILQTYYKKLIKSGKGCHPTTPLNPKTRVMGVLLFHGPMQMTEISQMLCVTKPHITTIIDDLIEEQLVKRLYDNKDRRVIKIDLTSKGKQHLIKIREEAKENIRENLQILNEADFNKLVNTSEEMIAVLTKIGKEYDAKNIMKRLKVQ